MRPNCGTCRFSPPKQRVPPEATWGHVTTWRCGELKEVHSLFCCRKSGVCTNLDIKLNKVRLKNLQNWIFHLPVGHFMSDKPMLALKSIRSHLERYQLEQLLPLCDLEPDFTGLFLSGNSWNWYLFAVTLSLLDECKTDTTTFQKNHSSVRDKKKRNLLYIFYIHCWTNSEKICTWFWNWRVIYEHDFWWSYTKHGQECFWWFWLSWQQPPTSPPSSPSPIGLLNFYPLQVAATFLGYPANDPDGEGGKKTTGGRKDGQVLSSSTSVQRTQCLRRHATWTRTWCMDSGLSDDVVNLSPRGRNSAEPHGDKCQCNTFVVSSAGSKRRSRNNTCSFTLQHVGLWRLNVSATFHVLPRASTVSSHLCFSINNPRQYQNSRLHDAPKYSSVNEKEMSPLEDIM